jgi:hypothetical protein
MRGQRDDRSADLHLFHGNRSTHVIARGTWTSTQREFDAVDWSRWKPALGEQVSPQGGQQTGLS